MSIFLCFFNLYLTSKRVFTIIIGEQSFTKGDVIMSDTKENILMTALVLFAKNGYEAVSVNDIASRIGITKGALYKHYKNKRAIFESIIKRMYEIDAQRAEKYDVPYAKAVNQGPMLRPPSTKSFTLDVILRQYTPIPIISIRYATRIIQSIDITPLYFTLKSHYFKHQ